MHTCKPPKAALEAWLEEYESKDVPTYGHLLLEQIDDHKVDLVKELRPYFESAHLDAREHFHKYAGIELHPDAAAGSGHPTYPSCLDSTGRKGLFGEVVAGLITESYPFIGGHKWTIPVFLFRHHADVETYLFDLVRDPGKKRSTFGRPGTDFLGLSLDESGGLVRIITGEAKWRGNLTPGVIKTLMEGNRVVDEDDGTVSRDGKGIWGQLNKAPKIPAGLRQLQRLLEECDPDKFAATILSIDKILLISGGVTPPPKTDLVLIVGNAAADYEAGQALLEWKKKPFGYKAGNDLQVVEVILKEGDKLIDDLYQSLWT